MWWKTRWAASSITGENDRTLISYKESLDSAQTDPDDPPTWTGSWRDPRFSPPGDGGQPENALTGQLWTVDCCSYADQVPSAFSKLAIWKNTAVANLPPGQTYTMPGETLGPEWDSDVDNGFRPPGEIDMSKTCEDVSYLLVTPSQNFAPGNACNSLTLYRASSGALVFDAGTIQWSWGLNSDHDGDSNNSPDPAMQQSTINLFAMMGVQPATLMSGLVPGMSPMTPLRRHRRSLRHRRARRSPTAALSRSVARPPTPAAAWWQGSRCPPTVVLPGILSPRCLPLTPT